MKKKCLILLFLFFPFFVFAYSKDDVFNLIDTKICEEKETSEYLKKYVNLIKVKDISEKDLNFIYENVSNILEFIKKNNIRNLEDFNKLNNEETKKIISVLKEIKEKINNSPYLNNLYNNGEYIEKNERNEFNYVGLSKYLVNLKYILIGSTLIIFIFLILSKKKKLDEILTIILVLLLFVDTFYYLYIKYPIKLNIINLLNFEDITNNEMEVKNKKVLNYPLFASLIGNLQINDKNIPIFFGESKDIYEIGLSQIYSFPGFDGKTIISGHNNILNFLEDISFNSNILIKTNYGIFTYSVYKIEVLNNNEFKKLDNKNKILIIYTCYPFNEIKYSNQRFVVYASLIKEEWYA